MRIKQFFADDSGKVVVAQKPNVSILLAAFLWLIARFTRGYGVHSLVVMAFRMAIVYWALLEIFKGDTLFRRFLGAVVVLATAYSWLNL